MNDLVKYICFFLEKSFQIYFNIGLESKPIQLIEVRRVILLIYMLTFPLLFLYSIFK